MQEFDTDQMQTPAYLQAKSNENFEQMSTVPEKPWRGTLWS